MERKINYDVKQKNGLSKAELEKLLLKWQKKLFMDDWEIDLKIVDFERKDFRQSGDFIADLENKKATILLTWNPWRGDEEYALVHEMIHVLIYSFDRFVEQFIIENQDKSKDEHGIYLDKLEKIVHQFTQIILGRPEPQV